MSHSTHDDSPTRMQRALLDLFNVVVDLADAIKKRTANEQEYEAQLQAIRDEDPTLDERSVHMRYLKRHDPDTFKQIAADVERRNAETRAGRHPLFR